MEHTSLPWKVHTHSHIDHEQWLSILQGAWDITHNGASNPAIVACSKYSAMTDAENLANAEFIVRAVNSHDDLVEALEFALQQLIDPNRGPSGTTAAQDQVQKALAKAGKEN